MGGYVTQITLRAIFRCSALRGQSQRPSIIAASGGPVNEARQWCGRLIETVEVIARVTTHVIRREVARPAGQGLHDCHHENSESRIGAVVAMRVEDYFANGKRWWVRLHEKGGKRHEMPAHHKLEAFRKSAHDQAL
jgi:hypothetical protein